ncbi:MAG: ABC transporter permease [Spirochaetaceae bacterium]|jgi:simple sugar transport system permease protein|nr:ABC transporter permease [Spirochaetaceae bacterium]
MKIDIRDRILKAFTTSNGLVSLVAVILGFLLATILVLAVGRNPGGMYAAILQVLTGFNIDRGIWNPRYIGEWIVSSMPLILCGFSMGFAARAGLFNIGAEGQLVVGLTAAQFVALFGPQITGIHWFLAVVAAALAGALWGSLSGFLKARYSVSEVVSTIMMNYIALYASRALTMLIPGSNTYRTPAFPETALLRSDLLASITNGSRLSYGLWITIFCIIFYYIVMEKTRYGFALRATGFNKDAARYAGIHVNSSITVSMAISGAFAGIGGAVVALGAFNYGRVLAAQEGYGFDGIAVALVGNSGAWGTAISGLLFGMLKSAQPLMQSRQIPKEIASIILGLVVVIISLRSAVQMLADWQNKKRMAQ